MNRSANDLLHFLKLACELIVAVQNFLGTVVEFISLASQTELFLAPINDKHIKMAFHGTKLLTYGRLGDAVEFRRPRETLRFDEIGEDFKVLNVHKGN